MLDDGVVLVGGRLLKHALVVTLGSLLFTALASPFDAAVVGGVDGVVVQ